MEKIEYTHFDRQFLNKTGKGSTAAIAVSTGIEKYYNKDNKLTSIYNRSMLAISDCSRKVDLELDFGSDEDYENSLFKLQTMIDVLTAGKKGLIEAREQYIKCEEEAKINREASKDEEDNRTIISV